MLAETVLIAAGTYALCGVVVAAVVHGRGLRRLDSAAASAPLGFRLIITPGLVVLWPLVLARTLRGTTPNSAPVLQGWATTRLVHRIVWLVAPMLVLVIIAAAIGAPR